MHFLTMYLLYTKTWTLLKSEKLTNQKPNSNRIDNEKTNIP